MFKKGMSVEEATKFFQVEGIDPTPPADDPMSFEGEKVNCISCEHFSSKQGLGFCQYYRLDLPETGAFINNCYKNNWRKE